MEHSTKRVDIDLFPTLVYMLHRVARISFTRRRPLSILYSTIFVGEAEERSDHPLIRMSKYIRKCNLGEDLR